MYKNEDLKKTANLIRKVQNIKNTRELIIKLEKRGINEPSFIVIIDKTGRVNFNGIDNVKIMENKTKEISQVSVEQILSKLSDVYFFSLKNSYTNLQQQPKSFSKISLKADDLVKEVLYDKISKIPNSILSLEQTIIDTSGIKEWI